MLSLSVFSFSQDKNIIKLSLINNSNIHKGMVGFDFGNIYEDKYYILADLSLPFSKVNSGYLNMGLGRVFNEKIYIAAIFGVYSENYMKPLKPNGGFELGLINKRLVTSIYIYNIKHQTN